MKKSNIILGVFLVIIGVILGLNALEITNINIFFKGWWTLFIIVPSVNGIIDDNDKTTSIITLIIGISLFLGIRDIIDFSLIFKLLIPIIIIVIGISLIFKGKLSSKIQDEIKELKKNTKDECYATFSSQDIKVKEEFKGITLNAIFGGIKYDLRDAKIKTNSVINITSIFGGVEIFVPNNVRVEIKSNSIFGGISNQAKQTKDKKEYVIYINGTCLFGGVEIK